MMGDKSCSSRPSEEYATQDHPQRAVRHRGGGALSGPEDVARRWLDLVFEAGDLTAARELSVPELHDQLADIASAGTLIDPATWTFSAVPQRIVDGQLVVQASHPERSRLQGEEQEADDRFMSVCLRWDGPPHGRWLVVDLVDPHYGSVRGVSS